MGIGSIDVNSKFSIHGHKFSPVRSLSRVWLFATPWTATHQASLGDTGKTGKPGVLQFMGSQKVSHNLANWTTTNVQFSCSVICYSFGSHGLQHTRLPGPSQLLEPTQTHVRCVSDAIQPSHPLSSPSPPAFNLSQHQSLQMCQFFTSGGQSIGASASVSVLPMNIQDWFPLELTGLLSFCSPRDSQDSSVTPEFKSITSSALSFLYNPTLTTIHDTGKTIAFN